MPVLKSFRMRIDEIIEYLNISRAEFERRAGLSNGYTRNLGGTPGADKLESILNAFPIISRSWLLTGNGEMLNKSNGQNTVSLNGDNEDYDLVPFIPMEAMAGSLQGFSKSVDFAECRRIKSPIDGADWVIQINGNSMEPEYRNGAYLFIRKLSGSYIPWGNTLVIDTNDGIVVKNVFPVVGNDNAVEARSINPNYPPFIIEKSSIVGIYRILAFTVFNTTI